jgi:hypothetical protein
MLELTNPRLRIARRKSRIPRHDVVSLSHAARIGTHADDMTITNQQMFIPRPNAQSNKDNQEAPRMKPRNTIEGLAGSILILKQPITRAARAQLITHYLLHVHELVVDIFIVGH